MIELELKSARGNRWLQCATKIAKAAAEAAEQDWDSAHVRVSIPGRKAFIKLPGHLALKEK